MTIVYSPTHLTAKATLTRDACANGTLDILTGPGGTVLVSFGLSDTGGTVSGAVWTLALDAATVAAVATGTAARARIRNSGGTDVITDALTVGEATGVPATEPDIIVENVSINAGQNVSLNSATFTER